MALVKQRERNDCGVACLAMLCDATYEEAYLALLWRHEDTTTKQLREGAMKLGYSTESTPQHRLKPLRIPEFWEYLPSPALSDFWYLIPNNSLVKIPHPEGPGWGWHWVVWRKGHIYDPARGVFSPAKYGSKPTSYMEFKKETKDV